MADDIRPREGHEENASLYKDIWGAAPDERALEARRRREPVEVPPLVERALSAKERLAEVDQSLGQLRMQIEGLRAEIEMLRHANQAAIAEMKAAVATLASRMHVEGYMEST